MQRVGRFLIVPVLLLCCWTARELRLVAFREHQNSLRYEDIYYLPPASWLSLLSLGYRAALADLIWCRSLIYFGEELAHRGAVKYAFEYTDAVLALAPDFRAAYTWIGTAALYRATDPTPEEAFRAADYLKRAVRRWPNDGELHWRYGSLLRFEIAPLLAGPGQEAERERVLAQSAPHLATAASLGAGPAWLSLNSSTLLERAGKTDQAIRHLEEVYATVQDDRTRRQIEQRLSALRSETFVDALRTANADFEKARRAAYPYLSPNMFMLVGERYGSERDQLIVRRFLPALPAIDVGADETEE